MSFPIIITDRLKLRELSLSDEKEIYFLRSDERVIKYTSIPKANSIEDARAFIEKISKGIDEEWLYWAITLKNDNTLIGNICLWNFSKDETTAEIGYTLHPHHQGKGIMKEAMKAVIDHGFKKLMLEAITADVDPENIKSINVLEKEGFILDSRNDEGLVIYKLTRP